MQRKRAWLAGWDASVMVIAGLMTVDLPSYAEEGDSGGSTRTAAGTVAAID